MNNIDISAVTKLQRDYTKQWHHQPIQHQLTGFYKLVANNHQCNYELWHEEDKARRDDKGFEYVYHAKRNIDQHNQNRNDFIEKMDLWIAEHYQPATSGCPANSETPGMIIDRLSILALKRYHMHLQTIRNDVDTAHIERCQQKLTIIDLQLQHLSQALSELLNDISNNTRTFYLYQQFKMYNDKTLNPQLYKASEATDVAA